MLLEGEREATPQRPGSLSGFISLSQKQEEPSGGLDLGRWSFMKNSLAAGCEWTGGGQGGWAVGEGNPVRNMARLHRGGPPGNGECNRLGQDLTEATVCKGRED